MSLNRGSIARCASDDNSPTNTPSNPASSATNVAIATSATRGSPDYTLRSRANLPSLKNNHNHYDLGHTRGARHDATGNSAANIRNHPAPGGGCAMDNLEFPWKCMRALILKSPNAKGIYCCKHLANTRRILSRPSLPTKHTRNLSS